MELLNNSHFVLGVVAGLVLALALSIFREMQETKNMFRAASDSKNRINKMLDSVRKGEKLDLDSYYPQPRRAKETRSVGYLFWRDLALWLALIYNDYAYLTAPIDEYFSLARKIFGEGCAYIKLNALNETLNRSTAYLIPQRPNEKENKETCKKNLLKLVFMITDSYTDKVYEDARVDIVHE